MHTFAQSFRSSAQRNQPALIPYLTAGFPTKAAFVDQLRALAPLSAAIEVGVPFSDPMADGVTIQGSSRVALEQGVSLDWILDQLASLKGQLACPLAIMSYLNPLLSIAPEALGSRLAGAGVRAVIIPDLPFQESLPLLRVLSPHAIGLVQMVSPLTPPDRAQQLARATGGFLYAVTSTGVTGGKAPDSASNAPSVPDTLADHRVAAYLANLRTLSTNPVAAGFGIRTPEHVRSLRPHADALIVGSALIEAIARNEKPDSFLRHLMS